VLEYIIGLDTQPKRDKLLITAGCMTAEDLLYVKTENLLACLKADTPIIAKTRLKTLKKWVEDIYDVSGRVDIHAFTLDVCKEHQQAIARTSKPSVAARDKATVMKEKLRTFNGSGNQWLRSKRKLTAYLNQIMNEQGIPIYYVIRDRSE
jgi:hypothetical protein